MLYARTIRHLRPSQVLHRMRLRAQRGLAERFPGMAEDLLRRRIAVGDQVGWPDGYEPLGRRTSQDLQDPGGLLAGRIELLNIHREGGWPPDWGIDAPSQLWRYHLQYLEWAWSYTDGGSRADVLVLWRSWRANNPLGQGDAWHPYVASLRAWVLCDLYSVVTEETDGRELIDDLALHAGYLRTHVERDVGGNHLMKNLKALVGLGVFFRDHDLLRAGLWGIEEQLDVQVLADGGHFELSPSYHAQVLEDLIDVANLLAAAGQPGPPALNRKVEAMRGWLSVMLMPDGDVPLFNDCVRVGRERLEAMGVRPALNEGLTVLPDSGYFVARRGPFHLVGDVGLPCPDELPAHAQADCLSFVLAVRGERVIVDTGTSTYEGARRKYERSTLAHNTVEIDGQDQTEVWGRFRAARRARPTIEETSDDGETILVQASHDGYRRLAGSPVHRRRWELTAGRLTIIDRVVTDRPVSAAGHLHLAPEVSSGPRDVLAVTAGPVKLRFSCDHPLDLEMVAPGQGDLGQVSSDFNRSRASAAAIVHATAENALELRTVIEMR